MVWERWPPDRPAKVGLRDFNLKPKDPMTEDRLPLAELLAKAGEGDFLRSVVEAVMQLLMETDATATRSRIGGHDRR